MYQQMYGNSDNTGGMNNIDYSQYQYNQMNFGIQGDGTQQTTNNEGNNENQG